MKTIKDMPEHSRRREKLRQGGAAALTDEDLVAAILGMGTAGIDVRTMSRQVAALIRENGEALTLENLQSVPGMGPAKGAQILSAFELARRHLLNDTVKIQCAEDVIPLLADIVSKTQEHFVCIAHVEFHGKILFWFGGRRRISKRILWTRFAEMMDDLASA